MRRRRDLGGGMVLVMRFIDIVIGGGKGAVVLSCGSIPSSGDRVSKIFFSCSL